MNLITVDKSVGDTDWEIIDFLAVMAENLRMSVHFPKKKTSVPGHRVFPDESPITALLKSRFPIGPRVHSRWRPSGFPFLGLGR